MEMGRHNRHFGGPLDCCGVILHGYVLALISRTGKLARRPDEILTEVAWYITGLAAGFDKDAEAVEGLMGLGFGFVEIGTHPITDMLLISYTL